MQLWRISEYPDLDGRGGLFASGRWNSVGRPIVYTAGSSALALLEVLARRQTTDAPEPYQLLEIAAPDDLPMTEWPVDGDPRDRTLTRQWGDAFLRAAKTPLARVPSVIAPFSWNWLLNPYHPDAKKVRIVQAGRWPWDTRLFGRT